MGSLFNSLKVNMDLTHEDKLMPLFVQLSAAVLERGLNFSRHDDPHGYASAIKWIDTPAPGCHFELRVDLGRTGEQVTTRGVITDAGGDALAELFSFVLKATDHDQHL
jgi:hypothetical protein